MSDVQLNAMTDEKNEPAFKWLPVINTDRCVGCGTCVRTCQRGCLQLVWDFSTLTRPNDCWSCGACMKACPQHVIQMDWVKLAGDKSIGRWCVEPPKLAPPRRHWLERVFGHRKS